MTVQTNAEGAALGPMPFVFGGANVVGTPIIWKGQPVTKRQTAEDTLPYGQAFEITHPKTHKPAAVWFEIVPDPGNGVHSDKDGKVKAQCQLMYLRKNRKGTFDFPISAKPSEQCVNRTIDIGEERFDLYEKEKGMTHATAEDVVRLLDNAEKNAAAAQQAKRSKDPVDVMAMLLEMVRDHGVTKNKGYEDAKAHAAEVDRAEAAAKKGGK
jgi:hypothetical protein